MKKEIIFLVQGSAADPYQVRFVNRGGNNISAYCSCPAGVKGTHCKHRINIFSGKILGIVSDNQDLVKEIVSWLPGSDIEEALQNVEQKEYELDIAKSNLNKAKKQLAQSMLN